MRPRMPSDSGSDFARVTTGVRDVGSSATRSGMRTDADNPACIFDAMRPANASIIALGSATSVTSLQFAAQSPPIHAAAIHGFGQRDHDALGHQPDVTTAGDPSGSGDGSS